MSYTDHNSMRQGAYTAITTQSEVTKIEGMVDHAQLRKQLKNATNARVVGTVFPYASPSTLCIQPRQILYGLKKKRAQYASHGGSGERVFGALNGFNVGGYGSDDGAMRDLFFAGVSKTSIPLQGMPNGEYADSTGIAYLVSGSISIDRNSGPKRILPGDLVQLAMPPKGPRNPNTNRAGIDPNHITLQTIPFDPANYGIQLHGAMYSINRMETATPPGVEGVPFERVFKDNADTPDSTEFTNAQWMALNLRIAMDAIVAGYLETLVAENQIVIKDGWDVKRLFVELGALSGNTDPVLKACRANAILSVQTDDNRPRAEELKRLAPANDKYANFRLCGPQMLINGILQVKHEADRWVIGRCLAAAAPGDTLDIDIGRGRTGC
jgi:hypothetical protein